jgi:hypothetical protein
MSTAPPLSLSVFDSLSGASVRVVSLPWAEWVARFKSPRSHPSKADCPLISGVRFGDARSPRGSLRHNANAITFAAVFGDHDAGTLSIADAATVLGAEANCRALFYSSASHRPLESHHRWRVVLPVSSPLAADAEAFRALALRAHRWLGGCLSSESLRLSQAFFAGRVAGAAYEVAEVRGDRCIDEIGEPPDARASLPPPAGAHAGEPGRRGALPSPDEAGRILTSGAPGCQDAALALVLAKLREGWPRVKVAAWLCHSIVAADWSTSGRANVERRKLELMETVARNARELTPRGA